jgi:hypothetical protein
MRKVLLPLPHQVRRVPKRVSVHAHPRKAEFVPVRHRKVDFARVLPRKAGFVRVHLKKVASVRARRMARSAPVVHAQISPVAINRDVHKVVLAVSIAPAARHAISDPVGVALAVATSRMAPSQ